MVCRYTFDGPDGKSVTITGIPALKAYLATGGGLQHLLPARAAQVPAFKRSPVQAATAQQAKRPLDVAWMLKIDQVVKRVAGNLGSNPEIVTVWDLNDPLIPQDVRDDEQRARDEGKMLGDVRGFYWIPTGQTFMVASAIENEYDATVVLKHELDHFGLHQFFGPSVSSELEQIVALRRKDVIERAKTEGLYGKEIDIETATNAEIFASMSQADKLRAAEELVVYMAETNPSIGFVKRIVAAIKTWLRKNVPGFATMELSDAEIIRDFILPARAFVEQGTEAGKAMAEGARFNRSAKELKAKVQIKWTEPTVDSVEREDKLTGSSEWSRNTFSGASKLLYGEAFESGKLVGRVMLGIDGDTIEIDKAWVDKESRRTGIAKHMIDEAKARTGLSEVWAPNVTTDGQAFMSGVRFNRAPAPATSASVLTPPEQGFLRRTQANFQDNNNRIKEVQANIEKLTGAPVPEYADYYQAEDNRPGRIAARLADFREKMQAPLIEAIAKSGHTLAEVESLAHAMHAIERNKAVAKINPKHDPDSKEFVGVEGSGMNTDVAAEILDKYKDDKAAQKHAEALQKIARATLDLKLAYDRITQEQYDAYTNAYDFYVPLKGDGEYGPDVKRAMGHEEREEHIIENVMRDYEQTVVAGEKNLARQALAQLVLENPDNKLWTVGVTPKGRYVAGKVFFVMKDGDEVATFTSQAQVDAFMEAKGAQASGYEVLDEQGDRVQEFAKPLQDNEVPVYFKGQRVRIQIKNEALAQQLRPMNQEQMGVILGSFRSLLRWMSHAYTGYNPNFLITNTVRDMQEGTENMVGNYGPAMSAKAWSNYKSAAGALWHFARNGTEPTTEAGRMLKEYRMNGGKTGASYMSDLEQQGKTIQRLYDDAYGAGAYLKEGMTGKAAIIAGRKIIGGLAGAIEKMNQVTENSLRLALYMAMRQSGESAGKAAMAAKNVTVNFDRKGSQTSVMSALYLFFNPAVQGTANIIRTLVKGKYRKYAWGGLATIGALGAFAAGQGLDDDEDRWLGEGWETRTKKLVLNFGGKRVTVPLAQGLVPFYAIGVALEEVRRGKTSPTAGAGRVLSSFIDAYVPFNGLFNYDSDNKPLDAALAMTPTAVRSTLLEPAVNRNSFGSKIVPENEFTKDRPDNLKMNRNTKGTVYDSAAQGIAKAGELAGAGRYENDVTKVSPEMLKHHFRNFTGGLGTFIGDSASLARIAAEDPTAVELADVPVVKAFAKGQDVSPLRGRFYDLTKDARAVSEEFKQAKKAGDDAAMADIESRPDKAELLGLDKMIRSTTKAAAGLRDEMVDINADKSLSLAVKRAQLKALEKEEEELYRDAIKAFKD